MNPRNCSNLTPSRPASFGAALLALILAAGAAHASPWMWTITPYAWATDVSVDSELDGRQVIDETIPVTDLMKDLRMILQGRVEAQKGANGVMLDLFYVALEDEASAIALPQSAGEAALDSRIDMSIIDVAGVFDPKGDRQGFGFTYGARIVDQRATIDGTFDLASGTTVQKQFETHETLVDGLIGLRYRRRLTPHLSLQMQADASTGGTDYTWSAFPSLGYTFGDGTYGVVAGYRSMTINFKDDGDLDTEMLLSGPVLGFRMSF